ncbi:MAG: NAD-dependent epimerase/dehydratase family protein [bacterium]
MKPTALVTGACGFVGSNLAKSALEKGFQVRATDLPSADRAPLKGLDVEFIPSDVTKKETLTQVVEGMEYVFHPAAVFSYSAPRKLLMEVNVAGTENLCRAVVDAGDTRKFIQISTVEIYGVTPQELLPTREDAPKRPESPYAKSKMGQERVVLRFQKDHGLPVVIVRPGPVYGPGNIYGVAKMIREPARMLFLPIPTSMKTRLPLVNVKDVCGAAFFLAEKREAVGEAYNVVDDTSYTVYEFFKYIAPLLGKPFVTLPPVPNSHLKFWGTVAAELSGVAAKLTRTKPMFEKDYLIYIGNDFWFSNEKLKSTGYQLIYPDMKEGIKETIKWYRETGLIK